MYDDEVVNGLDLINWQIFNEQFGGESLLHWQAGPGNKSAWYIGPVNLTGTVGPAPQVMNVIISGSQSEHDPFAFDTVVSESGRQIAAVPVGLADTISIVFSENVNVSANSLFVLGLRSANLPDLAEFSYNPITLTATWRFEGWALWDQYLLHLSDSVTDVQGNFLDGEWTNPASITSSWSSEFPSGNGSSGGSFDFVMTLLPGDANLDGVVNWDDASVMGYFMNGPGGQIFEHGDFNGDGWVNSIDWAMMMNAWDQDFQNVYIQADFDQDNDVDEDDLAIMQANYGLSWAERTDGDFNGDYIVNDMDLFYAALQFGISFTTS